MRPGPYPLLLEPRAVGKVWGGRALVGRVGIEGPPDELIGEAWMLCAFEGRSSRIANGPWRGRELAETLSELSPGAPFPLLIKLLEATTPLSVQVHPDDAFAQRQGHPRGKAEAWIVLEADPGARVVHGVRQGISKAELATAIASGSIDLDRHLRTIDVRAGDVIPIPPGTVHATLGRIVWAEVQQSADLTYRLYDWGRNAPDRPLQVELGLAAAREGAPDPLPAPALDLSLPGGSRTVLWACPLFTMEMLEVGPSWLVDVGTHSFEILLPLDGTLRIGWSGQALEVPSGRAALVPAPIAHDLAGAPRARVLRVYVADLDAELAPRLKACGHSADLIARVLARF